MLQGNLNLKLCLVFLDISNEEVLCKLKFYEVLLNSKIDHSRFLLYQESCLMGLGGLGWGWGLVLGVRVGLGMGLCQGNKILHPCHHKPTYYPLIIYNDIFSRPIPQPSYHFNYHI